MWYPNLSKAQPVQAGDVPITSNPEAASLFDFAGIEAKIRMQARQPFPKYGPCDAKESLDDLFRLVSPDLFDTDYIDARSAASLIATGLVTFKNSKDHPRWQTSKILKALCEHGTRLNMVSAALFDLTCNAEYLHGRITNRKWIYCNRHRDAEFDEGSRILQLFEAVPEMLPGSRDRSAHQRRAAQADEPSYRRDHYCRYSAVPNIAGTISPKAFGRGCHFQAEP